MTMAFDKTLSW